MRACSRGQENTSSYLYFETSSFKATRFFPGLTDYYKLIDRHTRCMEDNTFYGNTFAKCNPVFASIVYTM